MRTGPTLVLGTVLALVGLAGIVLLPTEPTKSKGNLSARLSRERQALLELLARVRREWNPTQRSRVIARARERKAALEPSLLWLLTIPRHDLVPEGIDG